MAMFNGYVSHYPRLVETIGAGDVRHESLGNALGSCRLLSGRGSIRRRGGAVRQQRPGRWPEKWRLKGRFFCWKTRITYDWLVVWNMNFTFPYIGNNHPNWLIFFRGVETTNQMKDWEFNMIFIMRSRAAWRKIEVWQGKMSWIVDLIGFFIWPTKWDLEFQEQKIAFNQHKRGTDPQNWNLANTRRDQQRWKSEQVINYILFNSWLPSHVTNDCWIPPSYIHVFKIVSCSCGW